MRVVRLATLVLVALIAVVACGCDADGSFADNTDHKLSKSEWDTVAKIRGGQLSVISSDELAALRRDADLGKNVGRYRTERAGYQVWRLDTATGASCLLLAPEAYWSKPENSLQSCANAGN